jgi:hypothetical protein
MGPLAHLAQSTGIVDNLTSVGATSAQRTLDAVGDGATWRKVTNVDGSNQVVEASIANSAVTENKIGALAVTAGKVATGAITEAKIDAVAVTAAKVATGAIACVHAADGDSRQYATANAFFTQRTRD